ncbi:acyl-CoA thioesterase [Mesorhizobium xinjiangense]|uniref:acyl-CoA thioesterase n=1 Tax=Mesorhizobium xinjiangense TaxID=2678685 RepID=UPI0012ED5928|nr:thioesterase family protein [Mesorhizobium xinjiangense]
MDSFVETHRAFVNTWECDENAHMNVQFYLKRFDEAARFHAAMTANGAFDGAPPRVRLVRYHGELHAAATTRIRSATVAAGPHAGCPVHLMESTETGALSATALDSDPLPVPGATVEEAEIEKALPRSLDLVAATAKTPDEMLRAGGLASHRCIVQPGECNARGEMLEQFHVARFSDGAPFVWELAGIGTGWLREKNYGRVALEMKITHHRPALAGDALVQYSVPSTPGGKTFRLRHEIVRFCDNAPIATGEVVAVVLDLTTRKTVALPQTSQG